MNLPSTSSAQPLADWGLIRARGPDAASFLQGQLTNDIQQLSVGQAQLSGYCSAKGRLLASFVLWRSAPDEFLLACSRDLLAATLKRLSMFVLRAKCKLDDAGGDWQLFGLAGDAAQGWLGAAAPALPWQTSAMPMGQALRLPDAAGLPRYLLAWPATEAAPAVATLSTEEWLRLEVDSGMVRITQATAERFVPQMVNLELVGGVSFSKGCYPGQEVVARSQYRGTLKRRSYVFDVAGPALPGEEVFHSADPGQPAGQVALAAVAQGGGSARALVEVKLSALEHGSLHLGSVLGPLLSPRVQPYAIVRETES